MRQPQISTADFTVKPGSRVSLSGINPDFTGAFSDKKKAQKLLARNEARIRELQEILYAERRRSLLLVFQGMDAAGKDGAIKAIAGSMMPQGVNVINCKAPNKKELAHDYLWRIHRDTPEKGLVALFNRSHYEDVLIVRVHNMVPPAVWRKRYRQINDFEKLLTENGTDVLKFFIHIDKDEQLKRFKSRLDDPAKNWKISEADYTERELWDDYQRAYKDVLEKCSTRHAPWHIIPSNKKWFRNLVISQIVVDHLEKMQLAYPPAPVDTAALRARHFPGSPASRPT